MKVVVLANKPNSPTTTYFGNVPDVDGNSPTQASPPRKDRMPKTVTLTSAGALTLPTEHATSAKKYGTL